MESCERRQKAVQRCVLRQTTRGTLGAEKNVGVNVYNSYTLWVVLSTSLIFYNAYLMYQTDIGIYCTYKTMTLTKSINYINYCGTQLET